MKDTDSSIPTDPREVRIVDLEFEVARLKKENLDMLGRVIHWRDECDKARAHHKEYKRQLYAAQYGGE